MSLLKVPLLASITWALHTTMTPPNPPPAEEERLSPKGLEHLATTFPYIPKVFFWTVPLAEVAVLVAEYVPGVSVSQNIQDFLVRAQPPAQSNLRITLPFLVGWSLSILGSLLRQQCYRTLGSQFTFELGISKDHYLVTRGPYAYVRHPSYTGALFCLIGGLLCLLTPGSWMRECSGLWDDSRAKTSTAVLYGVLAVGAVVVTRAVTGRMAREDAMLQSQFGEEWERWAREVRWKLVSGVY